MCCLSVMDAALKIDRAGHFRRRRLARDNVVLPRAEKKDRGVFSPNDMFLLTYLYCLNGSVDKAETLIAANAAAIKKDRFVDWLWEKLGTDFGFHPPQ